MVASGTAFDFEHVPERRGSDSVKWNKYAGQDVLPLWIADMDFASPPPVLAALQARVARGDLGYAEPWPALVEAVQAYCQRHYDWRVEADWLVWLPGLVCGINLACRSVDGEVLTATPVYPPFLSAPGLSGRGLVRVSLREEGGRWSWDFAALEAVVTPATRLLLLCHPHNPVGRAFDATELTRLAAICERHDLAICSDEIHCDLLFDGRQHVPFATLSPEIARRCITLMAPSKTFNIAGLGASFAIIQNPELRRQFKHAMRGIVPDANILSLTAALAAYRHGGDWLRELLVYLAANRDFAADYIAHHFSGVRATTPEATYLTWLDCREAGIFGNPHEFFLKNANVALNDGAAFGPGGEGFVRLNFGCSRTTLAEGLERMRVALTRA